MARPRCRHRADPADPAACHRAALQPGTGDEIVVCARPDDQRIRDERLPAEQPVIPRAEWRLSEKTGISLDAETAGLAGGATSNRAMVRLKIKF